jgi:hypothetical protein
MKGAAVFSAAARRSTATLRCLRNSRCRSVEGPGRFAICSRSSVAAVRRDRADASRIRERRTNVRRTSALDWACPRTSSILACRVPSGSGRSSGDRVVSRECRRHPQRGDSASEPDTVPCNPEPNVKRKGRHQRHASCSFDVGGVPWGTTQPTSRAHETDEATIPAEERRSDCRFVAHVADSRSSSDPSMRPRVWAGSTSQARMEPAYAARVEQRRIAGESLRTRGIASRARVVIEGIAASRLHRVRTCGRSPVLRATHGRSKAADNADSTRPAVPGHRRRLARSPARACRRL